jgi:hypothetical protein
LGLTRARFHSSRALEPQAEPELLFHFVGKKKENKRRREEMRIKQRKAPFILAEERSLLLLSVILVRTK